MVPILAGENTTELCPVPKILGFPMFLVVPILAGESTTELCPVPKIEFPNVFSGPQEFGFPQVLSGPRGSP